MTPYTCGSEVEFSIWVSIAGTVIASLVCGDSDSGPTPGCTGFSIQSGDDSPQKFTISGNSIQTTSTPIDYELLSAQNFMYTLVVTASDDPLTDSPKTGSSTVLVRITPLNDNDPVFTPNSYTAQVYHFWIDWIWNFEVSRMSLMSLFLRKPEKLNFVKTIRINKQMFIFLSLPIC